MALQHQDNGYFSRKLFITLVGMTMVMGGGIASALWPLFAAQYSTLVGGIMGLVGIYLTGNVANSLVVGKVTSKLQVDEPSDKENPKVD